MTTGYKLHNGTLYDYTCGVYCGVLIKESTMKKLARLQQQHLEAVKRVLADEADKGNVFPSMWTLHYPNDQQVTVKFISTSDDLSGRIRNATTMAQPKPCPLVFVAASMNEARDMADAHYAATKGE